MITASQAQQNVKTAGMLFTAVAFTLGGIFGILALSRDNTHDLIGAEIRPVLVRLDSLERGQKAAERRFERIEDKLDKQSEQIQARLNRQSEQIAAGLDKQGEQIVALTTAVARLASSRERRP